jgi:PDZ domain/Aspartyl protease
MNRRIFRGVLAMVIALHCVASLPRQAIPQSSSAAPLATIPFELANRHIMLKVSVNNSRPLSFVLDTGDDVGIIDLERARELGLKLEGEVRTQGAGPGSQSGSRVKESTFTIPGLEGFSQPIRLALPVGRMSPRLGQDFDGIIGGEFIKEFVVEIDYQTRQLKLYNKTKFNYTGPGESIPLQLNSARHPVIEAEVTPIGSPPAKGKFILDIGSGGALVLHSPFVAEKQLLSQPMNTFKAMGAGAGGEISGRIGRVLELKIGQYKISNPLTMFSEDKAGAFANSSLMGNIGAQIMNRFRVFLDYEGHRLILEPNSNFERPFDRAFDGLALLAEGKDYRTFRVREVVPDSPATEAGLQKDDIITEVNGKPAAEFSLTQLYEMFERPGSYKLKVRRGEQTLNITLTPKRLV